MIGKAQDGSDSLKQRLTGEWRWVRTTASFIGAPSQLITPESCSCSKRMEINPDTISLFRNDTLTGSSGYTIQEVRFMQDPMRYVLSSRHINDDVRIQGDTLVVGLSGICGTIDYYVPEKK